MSAAVCMILTAAMLAYMVRYRIHIHVISTPSKPRRRGPTAPALELRPSESAIVDPKVEGEIAAALRGLGCTASRARAAARQAISAGNGFEETLRAAIQIAHKETAA